MKKRIAVLLSAALILLNLTACSNGSDASSSAESVPSGTSVETQSVQTGDIATESVVTGSVNASRSVPVLSKVACKVKSVAVQSGSSVGKGAVLFTLDTADLQDLYGTMLTTYDSTKALLDEQVRQTQESLDNLQTLYQMGAVSWNQVEQTQLALMQAENARETTLAQLGLNDVLDAIKDPNVYSPIAGTISSVGVTAGVTVANTAAAVVVSEIGHPQVVVNVSETLQPAISIGDKVEVEIPSIGEDVITGTVASVASAVSQTSALYEVHIDIPDGLKVSLGMFARVTFRTDSRTGTVLVPTESILTDSDTQYVYIVKDATAFRVDITTGLVGETQTEVTSGLDGGEQLVTRGQSYLSDGAPVNVTEGSEA